MRPAVNQVTDAEQPVHCRVETCRIQALIKTTEMPVDIAHGQVTPLLLAATRRNRLITMFLCWRAAVGVKWSDTQPAPEVHHA